jgi:predicted dithiol-disulfide oxidoreductase (DUF899 family)
VVALLALGELVAGCVRLPALAGAPLVERGCYSRAVHRRSWAMPDGIADAKHEIVSHERWLAARKALLAREKELSRQRDELARQRRALPWERVDKRYVFDAPGGERTLAELFGRASQLVVYHFMYGPESEVGCPHCSFWADHYDGMGWHLPQRDVSFVCISRAPLAKIEAFRKRMGWNFAWVSSGRTDFNRDLLVSFTPEEIRSGSAEYNYAPGPGPAADREGLSVFFKDADGAVYHTYSTYARGIDLLNGTYNVLDLVPKGRDEDKLPWVQAWVRHHDQYGEPDKAPAR